MAKGETVEPERVLKDIVDRDYADSHRGVAPLEQAEDAVVIDSTEMSIEAVTEKNSCGCDGGKITLFYDCIRAVLKVLAFVLMPVRVYGRENLDREGAYILACNHQSYMDVPCLIIADKKKDTLYGAVLFFTDFDL